MNQPVPSSTGSRLARGPFAAAVLVVYVLGFASQMLVSPPVTRSMSVLPFVIAQAVLVGIWIVLHMRRLRDAGRPGGTAIGVAMVYSLAVALFTLLVWLIVSSASSSGEEATLMHLFMVIYLLSLLSGDASLGGLQFWLMGLVVVMLLPVVIAVGFTIWTGTRPSAGTSAAP